MSLTLTESLVFQIFQFHFNDYIDSIHVSNNLPYLRVLVRVGKAWHRVLRFRINKIFIIPRFFKIQLYYIQSLLHSLPLKSFGIVPLKNTVYFSSRSGFRNPRSSRCHLRIMGNGEGRKERLRLRHCSRQPNPWKGKQNWLRDRQRKSTTIRGSWEDIRRTRPWKGGSNLQEHQRHSSLRIQEWRMFCAILLEFQLGRKPSTKQTHAHHLVSLFTCFVVTWNSEDMTCTLDDLFESEKIHHKWSDHSWCWSFSFFHSIKISYTLYLINCFL